MADERFHLWFPEIGTARSDETAAEPLDTRDRHARSAGFHNATIPFEDVDADVLDDLADLLVLIGVVIVVPQDGDRGNGKIPKLAREDCCFCGLAASREIARDEEHVGSLVQVL
jgi:hypothetical protein